MAEQEKRILIVDDNQEIHTDFSKVLRPQLVANRELAQLASLFDDRSDVGDRSDTQKQPSSYQIDSAFQGEEAIAKVRQSIQNGTPYSLAFVDVRMPPGLDGIETTRQIWEIDPEIQIVICSAYSDYSWDEIVEKLRYSDRFLILKKPFESIEVRQLAAALHQRWVDARSDVLTGLVNRRVFLDSLHRQFRIARDERSDMSCVMIDLDFFKRVNDEHGHRAGDKILRETASVLSSLCREGDHVCRYGGEEFCVGLRQADLSQAQAWAQTARQALAEHPITIDDQTIHVTASFGVASRSDDVNNFASLLSQADQALRVSKQRGRDQVTAYADQLTCPSEPNSAVRSLFQTIDSSQLMRPPHSITRESTLKDAASVLIRNNLASAPVVDDEGKLIGVLNESDLLQVFSDTGSESLVVRDAMRASVVGFPEGTSLQEIFDFLVRVSIPQVVIVRDGKPRGVIGRKILLEWLCANGFGKMAPAIESAALTDLSSWQQPSSAVTG